MFVHQLIQQGTADSIAFWGNKSITYGQLQSEVTKYRNYFYRAGMRTGENVALSPGNSV